MLEHKSIAEKSNKKGFNDLVLQFEKKLEKAGDSMDGRSVAMRQICEKLIALNDPTKEEIAIDNLCTKFKLKKSRECFCSARLHCD